MITILQALLLATPFIIMLVYGGFLIEYCLDYINQQNKITHQPDAQELGQIEYGKYIGYVERILIFVLILSNNHMLISSIIVVKTVVRFEEFKYSRKHHTNFAERYLVGTLLSFLYAIVLSYVYIWLLGYLM